MLLEVGSNPNTQRCALEISLSLLVAQTAYPHLRRAKGRIINIGSLGGLHPWPTHGHYCTSKAALHMLTQTMAKAWAPEISVNCVAPGMVVNGEVDPAYEHFANKTPCSATEPPTTWLRRFCSSPRDRTS